MTAVGAKQTQTVAPVRLRGVRRVDDRHGDGLNPFPLGAAQLARLDDELTKQAVELGQADAVQLKVGHGKAGVGVASGKPRRTGFDGAAELPRGRGAVPGSGLRDRRPALRRFRCVDHREGRERQ